MAVCRQRMCTRTCPSNQIYALGLVLWELRSCAGYVTEWGSEAWHGTCTVTAETEKQAHRHGAAAQTSVSHATGGHSAVYFLSPAIQTR